jgi:hypothetical protein
MGSCAYAHGDHRSCLAIDINGEHGGDMKRNPKNARLSAGLAMTAAFLLTATLGQAWAANDQKSADTYTWSAELVSFDPSSRMITVKSHIDGASAIEGLDELKQGDPITLTWVGLTWGAGIRGVTRGHEASTATGASTDTDALMLPAEFVGTEMDDQYITYRLPIPADAAAKIQALKAGDWVTATSPRHPADTKSAVVAIRGYNDVS